MNDAETLVLIHALTWPILIWLLSKTWSYHVFPLDDESGPVVPESSQLIILAHDETLTVVAMRGCNPDRSTVGVISGVRPVSTPLAQSSRVYLAVLRRMSRITSVERNFKNENLYCL